MIRDTNIRAEPFRFRLKQIIFIIVVMFIIAINNIDNMNAILIAFAAFFPINNIAELTYSFLSVIKMNL
ncbi:hypothetical protein RG56_26355 (plasmid) [Escherichia coli]|nr:hypothetical protein RG56_26355 [Escherichia coli]ECU0144829.1 hypothetical protein [Salmonella enterica subsp. enterica serovar Typhimurium]MMV35496.1 hypothetical protein [Salmonella enterica subsp. enterica serovar Typhimurium]